MTTFRAQYKKAYQEKVIGRLEKTVRAVALIVDSELAVTTPVDTGRARSNWLPSLNVPETKKVEPGQKPPIDPTLKNYEISDTIYITNNLPYIQRLNDGYSKQAPAGFVEAAISKAKRAVK